MVTFEPVVIIYKGKPIVKNIKKTKYSIDNILQMLRENKIFDMIHVELAVIEANGRLSILEKSGKPNLTELGLNEHWVSTQLAAQQVDLSEIFLATVDDRHSVSITKYVDSDLPSLPPVHH